MKSLLNVVLLLCILLLAYLCYASVSAAIPQGDAPGQWEAGTDSASQEHGGNVTDYADGRL